MTEAEQRNLVVTTATNWLGRKEADGSFKPIIDVYNECAKAFGLYIMKYTDPWCAAFVTAVAWACGLTSIIFPECSCDRMIRLYKNAGWWQESDDYDAKVGDVIFYDWDDNGVGDCVGSSDHVGLIAVATDTAFLVIEGNKSDEVGQRTIQRDSRFIRGFGCPDYASKATQEEVSTVTVEEPTTIVTTVVTTVGKAGLSLPMIRKGSSGGYVKSLQLVLIGKGYSCGTYGADGDFGSDTEAAVFAFQRANSLEVDGIVGDQTWGTVLAK